MGRRAAFFGAALLVGYAINRAQGAYHPQALGAVLAAITLLVEGIRDAAWLRRLEHPSLVRAAPYLAATGLAVGLADLVQRLPRLSGGAAQTPTWLVVSLAPLALGLVLCAWPAPQGGRFDRLRAWPLLVTYIVVGAAMIVAVPHPGIDVFVFQRDALAALLGGDNPYALTFPNIYAPHVQFYGPGVVENDRVMFGFPYPPLSLFSLLPAVALGLDLRFAQLAALVGAAALIAHHRPGRLGALVAAALLLTPRSLFVVEQSWTEPLAIFLATLVVVTAERDGARGALWRAVSSGLLLVIKQTMVLLLPALWLLVPREAGARRRHLLLAFLLGAAVSLPLALLDPNAFFRSAVLWQFIQPVRPDALSLNAVALRLGTNLPVLLAFVAALGAAFWAARSSGRGAHGFAASAALTLGVFFVLNKQAFCNYYFLVLALALLATLGERAQAAFSPAPNSSGLIAK